MELLSIQTIDRYRRIVITDLFRDMPKEVVLTIDCEHESICVYDANTIDFGTAQKVDAKNRIIVPGWIYSEFSNYEKFCFYIDKGKHYISPKTGKIL